MSMWQWLSISVSGLSDQRLSEGLAHASEEALEPGPGVAGAQGLQRHVAAIPGVAQDADHLPDVDVLGDSLPIDLLLELPGVRVRGETRDLRVGIVRGAEAAHVDVQAEPV